MPKKLEDAAASTAETIALDADTATTNANTVAKGRLAVATTAATGGMNLILAALTAAAVGGSIYAASLGAAGNATQSAIQKNEDLIAAKKQELEMNQKQVEFIGTLGESYSKMQQSLIAVGDDEKKATQIKKDMQATEDELAKIVGKDAAERITHSEDINAAITHEQEVHAEKGKNIQKSLDNIVTVQKQLRDDTINYCNDRIDAINNEAVAFDKAADAIEEALGRIDAAMYRFHENNAKEARAKADELQQSGADKSGAQILADATGWQPLKDIANSEFFKNRDAYYENANQEAIEGLRGFAEKEEAAKQEIADRAKTFYSNKGAGAAGLGNHWYPSGDGSTVGGDETTPGGGGKGKGKGTGRERKGDSAYTIAKRQYEEDVSLANYSANEKLYLYHKYLDGVEKSDKERLDFLKGQHSLDSETYKDSLKIQSDELEMQLAKRQISQEEYLQKQVELKRQSLDKELQTEIEHRELSDQSAGREQRADDAYKTEIQGTAWYIAALKESYNVEKKLSDYQIELAKKVAEYHQQIALDEISAEEKKYQTLYDRGQINEQQLLTLQSDLENQRFKIQSDSLNKQLLATLNDTSEIRAAYADYINSTTDQDRNAAAEKLINLTKNKTGTLSALKELETAYSQHADKVKNIDNSMWKELNKNILEAKNSMADALSQAFQDNLNGATSFLKSLQNILSSVGKTIEKQLTNAIAKDFTDKAFGKALNGNNKALQEKQNQTQITAQAALGAAARVAIEQSTAQQQAAITQQKAITQKGLELSKDQIITGSAQAMGQTVVSSIQASLSAMLEMLPTMLLMAAIGSLFGGGKSSTSSETKDRSASSYYSTGTVLTSLPSYDVGSFELPEDTLAMVHKKETILPVPFAEDFRAAVKSGSLFGGNSNNQQSQPQFTVPKINQTIVNKVSVMDGTGVRRALTNNAHQVRQATYNVNRSMAIQNANRWGLP
ncbi:hypothetical protein [Sporomusa acidovorans]|uniref:Chromosome partition protein Smc n=1 Tax=Sporomusa acidovorans (strain ATCC 49682 / DSM 3132 / Mol) TaxID=1123286 RepID=A0ABZ3IYY8_SPOA4|nr:hypothetical protein [Sporomusa acidovorans]OZC22078.1 hypothetical protein SPACI_15960 [Sporomusa acidovorans DSM 3132]SDF65872.1 hypothetical protein SAMN04488499_10663 [Sporomusa acidovorans]